MPGTARLIPWRGNVSPVLQRVYRARGVLAFEGCVPHGVVDRIREDFLRELRENPQKVVYDATQRPRLKCRIYDREERGVDRGERLRRWHLTGLTPIFYAVHRLLVGGDQPFDAAEDYLAALERDRCSLRLVNVDVNCMGSSLQHPHRDIPTSWRTDVLFANLVLTRCGAENGPLEIWPGTHLLRDRSVFSTVFRRKGGSRNQVLRGSSTEMTELAEHLPSDLVHAAPGDVIIRDPATFHRGTPSRDPEERPMLLMMFERRKSLDSWMPDAVQRYREAFGRMLPGRRAT
jgi:hypothetical protein